MRCLFTEGVRHKNHRNLLIIIDLSVKLHTYWQLGNISTYFLSRCCKGKSEMVVFSRHPHSGPWDYEGGSCPLPLPLIAMDRDRHTPLLHKVFQSLHRVVPGAHPWKLGIKLLWASHLSTKRVPMCRLESHPMVPMLHPARTDSSWGHLPLDNARVLEWYGKNSRDCRRKRIAKKHKLRTELWLNKYSNREHALHSIRITAK